MHRQFINSRLSCSICSFILLNSSISWQSLAWFPWKSLFLNSNSPYKLILPLWAWSAHRFACCSWNRWDSELLIDVMKSNIRISLFPIFSLHFCPSYFCWAIFSPRTANSAFRSRISWRFTLSLNDCTTFWSRSLFPFDSDLKKSGNNGFSVQVCRGLPDAIKTVNRFILTDLVSTRWELCLPMLCACCSLKLLSVEVHQVPRWWRLWWRRNRAGKSCCWGGWSACARRWHRCRSWAHTIGAKR